MLSYPKDIETKLEIDQVRSSIRSLCKTERAKQLVDKVTPYVKFDALQSVLSQTDEALTILSSTDNHPSINFEEIKPLLKRLIVSGSFIQAEDFLVLKKGLLQLYVWTQYLKKHREDYATLYTLTLGFISDDQLPKYIETIVDEKGEIRSNATPKLASIRNELLIAEQKVRKAIRQVLEKAKKDKFTDDDSELTVRAGRLVIPIKAEHKRKITGFVHDESATGQTVYLEPSQILVLNNSVRELQYQEKREIQRILISLSDAVREAMHDLDRGEKFLTLIDFILAKASFGRSRDAVIPKVSKTPCVQLVDAYHPLLKAHNESQGKKTVPLSLSLRHDEHRMVIISGPNAGGKSVAMKTVGILQYMFQCGFPVTVHESSVLGIFNHLFIDIGDAQSLENDLSTYSSRLTGMKYFVEFADKRSLVLMDEFGSGTEPQFGGAIAEAILDKLTSLRCYGVVTTHYANIKKFAETREGLVNAAMRYDTERLEPLFELEIGRPGSSFAFEIARKIGLPAALITVAQSLVGRSHVDFDQLLSEVESDKAKYEALLRETKRKEEEVKRLKKDYESMRDMTSKEQKKLIKEAKNEANNLIDAANKQIEQTIREIKESEADKQRTKTLREDLKNKRHEVEVEKVPHAASKTIETGVKTGDFVRLKGQETIGEVVGRSGKQVQVSFGLLKSFVTENRLEKVSNTQAKKEIKKRVGGIDLNTKMTQFKHDLDIRGKRAEETLGVVEEQIDNALILGVDRVRIVHGKGHGILREVVRNHLRSNPRIASMTDEDEERGGSGITVVTLQ
jgi:DNA mismatch repair protein MutS2